MKTLQALIFSAAIICIAAITASADTLTIAGNSNIFGAGHASAPGGGTLPSFVTFGSGQTILTFSSVTGTVTINVGSGSNANNPDGIGAAPADSNTTSVGGISGIAAPHAGYLVGIFETSTEPFDPRRRSLISQSIGTNFASLSPALNQTFFIGDGLTDNGTGMLQQFMIPAGATSSLFGNCGRSPIITARPDHTAITAGSFSATFDIVPEPSTWALGTSGIFSSWHFNIAADVRERSSTHLLLGFVAAVG